MDRVVGIDLGVKTIACSSGKKYEQPFFKISDNRAKSEGTMEIVRKLTVDWLNSVATRLVIKYDVIYIETLDVGILDELKKTAFNQFPDILKKKAELHEKKVIEIDQFYASSQTCSVCGHVHKETKNLSVRKWKCPQCNNSHDRDVNAAINILREGRSKMEKPEARENRVNMEYDYKVVD